MIGWAECWARLWRTAALALALGALWPAAVWVAHFMFWWWWYFVPVGFVAVAGGISLWDRILNRRWRRQLERRGRIRSELMCRDLLARWYWLHVVELRRWRAEIAEGCPICTGGFGPTCSSHWV